MPPKTKFQEGEKVLCFHGPLLYEAKCVKTEVRDKALHYFIHYNGWNKNWDEWVPEARVLKFNESTVQKQKELLKAHVQSGQKKSKTKAVKEKDTGQGDKGDKGPKAKGKGKEKEEEKERSSTPTVEKGGKQKGRGKDRDKEEDKEKERSSTPTVEKLSKQKGRGKDKDDERERSSRSSTPISDRTTKGKGRGRDKDKDDEKDGYSTPILDKPSKSKGPPPGAPSSVSTTQDTPGTAASTPTTTEQKRKRNRQEVDTPASSVDSGPSSVVSTPTEPKQRKRGRPESTPIDSVRLNSPQPSSQSSDSVISSVTSTPSTEVKRKRVRGENVIDNEESYLTKIEVKIKIPEDLKPWLVDDWDLITRQKHLLTLPGRQTVDSILDDYIKFKTSKPNSQSTKDPITEVAHGLKAYFNIMLGTQLLYKFERPQYGEILKEHPDKLMTSIYGAIHLLRLFVKLGNMLAYTSLDERSIQLLQSHIHDFLKYMQKQSSSLFSLSDYHVAPPDYHRKAI